MRTYQLDANWIKAMIDPIDFYTSEGQEITTRSGSPWKQGGLCPFHEDRHAGSFYIHSTSGGYCCFSCGAKGGDIINFTRNKYGLRFGDALRKLANEWRVV